MVINAPTYAFIFAFFKPQILIVPPITITHVTQLEISQVSDVTLSCLFEKETSTLISIHAIIYYFHTILFLHNNFIQYSILNFTHINLIQYTLYK